MVERDHCVKTVKPNVPTEVGTAPLHPWLGGVVLLDVGSPLYLHTTSKDPSVNCQISKVKEKVKARSTYMSEGDSVQRIMDERHLSPQGPLVAEKPPALQERYSAASPRHPATQGGEVVVRPHLQK